MTLINNVLTNDDAIRATCAPAVAEGVRRWRKSGYPGATPTTRRLLGWWFDTDHQIDGRPFAFYQAQREAIESLIYVHEVIKLRDSASLSRAFLSVSNVRLLQHGGFARYGVKMATGSGKTMVMALAMVWSFLNARKEPDGGYASSFLLIADCL